MALSSRTGTHRGGAYNPAVPVEVEYQTVRGRYPPILGAVPNQDRGPTWPFAAGHPQAPISGRSASGLVLPGISSTAWMLDLTPVHEMNAWLANIARSY